MKNISYFITYMKSYMLSTVVGLTDKIEILVISSINLQTSSSSHFVTNGCFFYWNHTQYLICSLYTVWQR